MKVWVVESGDNTHGSMVRTILAEGADVGEAMREAARFHVLCYAGNPKPDEDEWTFKVRGPSEIWLWLVPTGYITAHLMEVHQAPVPAAV